MLKINVTKEMQAEIDETGCIIISDEDLKPLRLGAICHFTEIWSFDDNLTGRDLRDMFRKIANG